MKFVPNPGVLWPARRQDADGTAANGTGGSANCSVQPQHVATWIRLRADPTSIGDLGIAPNSARNAHPIVGDFLPEVSDASVHQSMAAKTPRAEWRNRMFERLAAGRERWLAYLGAKPC
jgi:hypothetical protein